MPEEKKNWKLFTDIDKQDLQASDDIDYQWCEAG